MASMIKNSTIVVAGIIISNLLAYVFHIYVGRSLGPAEYGVFGVLMALLTIISLPAGAISSSSTKYIAKYNVQKKQGQIGLLRRNLSIKIITYSLIVFLLIILLSKPIANYLNIESQISVVIVGLASIFALMLPINRGVLQGMKKFKAYSMNTILESTIRLVLVVLFIYAGLKSEGAILAYGLAYFFAFLLIFPLTKEVNSHDKNEKLISPNFLKFAILVLIVNLIIQGIINIPTIFIKHYLTAEFTGLWTAALTLARISLFVVGGIILVMFPEVAEKSNHKDKRAVLKKAFILTLICSFGIALIFWIIPEPFINILYGSEFLGAVPILKWMSIAMIGIASLQLSLNYWLAGKKE